jgi:hypothetical protein
MSGAILGVDIAKKKFDAAGFINDKLKHTWPVTHDLKLSFCIT